jgi:putative ABC transport system ATP-binding protein
MTGTNQHSVFRLQDAGRDFTHGGGVTHAVRRAELEGRRGEVIVLLGPSGSGKTTLLSMLAGLIRPTAGRVELFGHDVASLSPHTLQQLRAGRMGFIFQTFHLFDVLKVLENITLVQKFNGTGRGAARQRAMDLMKLLEIADLAMKYPSQLSHGEKQRVAIARAVANRPELLLADEPTASLEWRQGLEVVALLQRCAREFGCCVVCATHDLRMEDVAGRVLRITDGVLEAPLRYASALRTFQF